MGNMSLQMFKYFCWPVYIKICMEKFTTVRSWCVFTAVMLEFEFKLKSIRWQSIGFK